MEQPKEIVTLDYYKTNVGIFLRNMWGGSYNGYHGTPYLDNYKFNGQSFPNILRGGNFFLLEGLQEITKCEKLKAATTKHNGYKLLDTLPPSVAASLKEFYSLAEVGQYWNDDTDQTEFTNKEFAAVRSMYKESYEEVPAYWYEVEIKHNLLGELTVTNYQEPEKMIVKLHAQENYGSNKTVAADLSTIACYSDIERMLTPEFMLHTRPCSLTSQQVYQIVRAHIKENINPRCAEITSDYNFCFTVKRKVHHSPINNKTEIKKANGRSYATPKFKHNTVSYKTIELFEMTNASDKYKGYTIIEGWKADNLIDLQQQVKYYLDMLMEEINSEAVQCECCGGYGAIVKKIETNNRSAQ